jgi:hypothetical protein
MQKWRLPVLNEDVALADSGAMQPQVLKYNENEAPLSSALRRAI